MWGTENAGGVENVRAKKKQEYSRGGKTGVSRMERQPDINLRKRKVTSHWMKCARLVAIAIKNSIVVFAFA